MAKILFVLQDNPVHTDLADYKFIFDLYIFHGISSSMFIGNRASFKTECTHPRVSGDATKCELGPPTTFSTRLLGYIYGFLFF